MHKRNAIIVAAAVEVHCPHCGDPQPSPGNGSFMWEPHEVTAQQGDRVCNACDHPFRLIAQNRMSLIGT